MIKFERPYIVYSLPASRVSQKMLSKKITDAWKSIQTFLENTTNVVASSPDKIKVEVFSPFEMDKLDPVLAAILEEAEADQRKGVWKVKVENLDRVLDYFTAIQSKLKSNYEQHLYLSYAFQWVNPSDKSLLPNQELNSLFAVYLARTHICLPTLFFPFDEPTSTFWNYLDSIKEKFPFELEERYLRLARLKNGYPSSFKKIERSAG
jgi:hypothetical protein